MGVGGHFWDLLKPYAKTEGFDFLRNKRVAVDLSFWIVQHETAIKGYTRNRHLRLTFFRTVNLFAKFGAFPVFVVDGTPSPLKSQARRLRFYRASGMDTSSLPEVEKGVSIERNGAFQKCVRECVELLELLGMPVIRSSGEAEALCAQLNREGHVDACITSDSDTFLFGAKCVIKSLRPSSKDPFECYYISDIEAGLGLTRKHLIAISLLVGNDHDLNGVPGIGLDTALRFVKHFSEDMILNRLHEIGRGEPVQLYNKSEGGILPCSEEISASPKVPHCSHCGHPGSKKVHITSTCRNCFSAGAGCVQKPLDFTCNCSTCDLVKDRKAKEQKKNENWWIRLCKKIASEPNFPNSEILKIYLKDNHRIDDGHQMSWMNPKTEMLIDYLAFTLNWEPSSVRQRILPMLSTIFLRDIALEKSSDNLLYGQYEFHSIQRVKVRWGHQLYVVRWKKAGRSVVDSVLKISEEPVDVGESEISDSLDEPDVPQIQIEDGCWFLLTDEDMELVGNAYPEKVNEFKKEKELKEMKSRRKKSGSVSPSPRSLQLSIKEFYSSSKGISNSNSVKIQDDEAKSSEKTQDSSYSKRKQKSPNFSKSARRKLLFG